MNAVPVGEEREYDGNGAEDEEEGMEESLVEASSHRTCLHYSEIRSMVKEKDLSGIRRSYHILGDYVLRVPRPQERMHQSREGGLAVFVAALQCGLGFPLAKDVSNLLWRINVNPTQQLPNSWSLIYTFVVVMKWLGQSADIRNFTELFVLQKSVKSGSTADTGFYYMAARPKRSIIKPVSSSFGKAWKSWWFYVYPPQETPFYVHKEWAMERRGSSPIQFKRSKSSSRSKADDVPT